jgi:RNA polymerase sigma-70 factor (ECF subfamily)
MAGIGIFISLHQETRISMNNDQSYPDSQLARKIRDSDSAAFKILFHRYYEPLYCFLCQRLRSSEQAKDFIQEVFTRVWQTRERLDPKQSIKAYLYRIANNLTIDYFRKRASHKQYQREKYHQIQSHDGYIDTELSVNDAVSKLPDKLRTVFILSRYQSLTYNEIAEACKISVKTVESRMSQALRMLRNTLK